MSRPFEPAAPAAVYSSLPSRDSIGQPPGATAAGVPHSGGVGVGVGVGPGPADGGGAGSSPLQPLSRATATNAIDLLRKIPFIVASLRCGFSRYSGER